MQNFIVVMKSRINISADTVAESQLIHRTADIVLPFYGSEGDKAVGRVNTKRGDIGLMIILIGKGRNGS